MNDRRASRFSAARARACILLAFTSPAALVAAIAGCPGPTPRTPSPPQSGEAQFVGNAACDECHKKACEQHARSRHSKTLRFADIAALGDLAPPSGPVPGTVYSIGIAGGSMRFGRVASADPGEEIQCVFGSGKSGMTYVGEVTSERLTEFRMSYIPRSRTWYVTPGQEGRGDLDLGHVHDRTMARRCMLCHATTLPEGSVVAQREFFGVGCESCHGPGSEHIAAAKTHRAKDLKVERIRGWPATRIESLCARCHRSADDVSLVTRDASSTQRFQPYGLEMSRCYKESAGKLSCLTCHAPHVDAATDPKYYERICLSCHSAGSSAITRGTAARPAVCPINPREKCVGCHMPQRQVFPGSKVPVTMADHLIWAYGRKTTRP